MSAKLPKVAKLSPIVTRILGCNPGKFTLQGTNTYIIGSGTRRILLDTGDGTPEYADLLGNFLRDNKVEISTVLLSHWHPDHVGGLDQVLATIRQLHHPQPQVYKCLNGDRDGFDDIVVHDLEDRHVFKVDGATLVGYFTPGHADDHFVFWLQEENAIFSADNVLGEGSTVFSNLGVYIRTLERMLSIGSLKHMYPGHGPVIEDGVERIKQYIDHRVRREEEILRHIKAADVDLTIEDIVDRIYSDLSPNVKNAAERGILQHLHKLKDEKRVTSSEGRWRVVGSPSLKL